MTSFPLIERVGIDRIKLVSFKLNSVNPHLLYLAKKSNKYNLSVDYEKDESSSLIRDIFIKSSNGTPFYSFQYKCKSGKRPEYMALDLCVCDYPYSTNINNHTVSEVAAHADEVKNILKSVFGIDIDLNNSKISYIEINCNIAVSSFSEYKEIFRYAFGHFKYFGKNLATNEDRKNDKGTLTYLLNGLSMTTKSKTLKLYNKSEAILKTDKILLDKDILRLEIVFKKSQAIKNNYNTQLFSELDDNRISECFNKLVINQLTDILENRYPKHEKKIIDSAFKESLEASHTWEKFASIINSMEKDNNAPPVLGFEHIYELIDKYYKKDRPRTIRRFKNAIEKTSLKNYDEMPCHRMNLINHLKELSTGHINVVTVSASMKDTGEKVA